METILLSLSKSDFQDLIAETVTACLKNNTAVSQTPPQDADRWLNLLELCDYLPDKPAKPTVYAWVNQGMIPYHKGGKKLRFLKSEIDEWLKAGKQESKSDITKGINQFLRNQKRKSGGPKL
jgi:excisionase family DNA binding protein